MSPAARARQVAAWRGRETQRLGAPARAHWNATSLAGFRRTLLADLVVGCVAFAGIAAGSGALGSDMSLEGALAVSAAIGAAATMLMRRLSIGAGGGAASYGFGMLVFTIWRILATSLAIGEHDLAQSLGPPLALRIGAAMIVGALWGYLRGVRLDRRGPPTRPPGR